MNHHLRNAIRMFIAAKPESGFLPSNSEERQRLHRAYEELGYAQFRGAGMPHQQARELARLTFGSPAGWDLLEMELKEFIDANRLS